MAELLAELLAEQKKALELAEQKKAELAELIELLAEQKKAELLAKLTELTKLL
ncbi:unnamed protein product, partial [Sphagnum balticum]